MNLFLLIVSPLSYGYFAYNAIVNNKITEENHGKVNEYSRIG
jgi:hypothetical protein